MGGAASSAAVRRSADEAIALTLPRPYMEGVEPRKFFRTRVLPRMRVMQDALGLGESELGALFDAFLLANTCGSGEADIVEFCSFFDLAQTRLASFVFSHTDENVQNGLMDFPEFATCVWNVGTLDEAGVAHFCARLAQPEHDPTASTMASDVLSAAVSVAHGTSRPSKKLRQGIRALAEDAAAIPMERIADHAAVLFKPAVQLRAALRARTLSAGAWAELTRFRRTKLGAGLDALAILHNRTTRREARQDAVMRAALVEADALHQELDDERARNPGGWSTSVGACQVDEMRAFSELQESIRAGLALRTELQSRGIEREEELLGHAKLCRAMRSVETCAHRVLLHINPSMQELEREQATFVRGQCERDAEHRYATDMSFRAKIRQHVRDLVRDFEFEVRHGRDGLAAIPKKAFDADGPAGIEAAALRHALHLAALEGFAEHSPLVSAELRRERETRVAAVQGVLDNLLVLFGIDDSLVDPTLWIRDWDPRSCRYSWTAAFGGQTVFRLPVSRDAAAGAVVVHSGLPRLGWGAEAHADKYWALVAEGMTPDQQDTMRVAMETLPAKDATAIAIRVRGDLDLARKTVRVKPGAAMHEAMGLALTATRMREDDRRRTVGTRVLLEEGAGDATVAQHIAGDGASGHVCNRKKQVLMAAAGGTQGSGPQLSQVVEFLEEAPREHTAYSRRGVAAVVDRVQTLKAAAGAKLQQHRRRGEALGV